MIATIRLKDDTWLLYAGYDGNNPQRAAERQLERFKDFSPNDRALLLTHAQRKEIEGLRGIPFDDGAQLVEWVRKLKTFDVGGMEFKLSDAQLSRSKGWSDKMELPLEKWLRDRLQLGINQVLQGA